jgi:hypothetical protein
VTFESIPVKAARPTRVIPDQRAKRRLALDGWADGDIADLDIVGLFDYEGDGAGDGFGLGDQVVESPK